MAESFSNMTSKTFTNRQYMTVPGKHVKENNFDLHEYQNHQFSNRSLNDVSPVQYQSINQIKKQPSRNQDPSSRPTHSAPRRSIENSTISNSITESTPMKNLNQAASTQKMHQK